MMGGGRVVGGGRGSDVLRVTEGSASCVCRRVCVFERMNSALSPSLEGASKISKMGARVISSGSAGSAAAEAWRSVARVGAEEWTRRDGDNDDKRLRRRLAIT